LGAVAELAACLVSPTHVAAQAKWTLGSPSTLVAKLQGRPRLVERLVSLGYEVWRYGDSWVRLSYADDRVSGWWNADGLLKVEMRAGGDTTRERTFTSGSSRDDVVRLHGTPAALELRPESGVMLLRYGAAVVTVSSHNGRVLSWEDPRRTLRTRPGDPRTGGVADGGTSGQPDAAVPAAIPVEPPGRVGQVVPPVASLAARAVFVGPPTGDADVLDAESRAALDVTVWNDGPGVAYGVTAVVSLERPEPGLDVGRAGRTDSIAPGRGVTLRVELATSDRLRDGTIAFRVQVSDRSGRALANAPPLVVRTRAVRSPTLVLEGIGLRDQSGNGRIEPREIVDVTARIGNRGPGPARNVRVAILVGPEVRLTPESARDATLGDLRPGEMRDVRFSAFASAGATAFPVSLAVHEARPRFDTVLVLPLALDRKIAALPALSVRGRDLDRADPPPLVVDVDTGIVRAPPRPNAVAVVLGVERYERAPAVAFARRDAAVFREYARTTFGIGDDASRLYFRTDDEVTGGELRKLFGEGGWLSRRVTPETDVIVYWAGHGQTDTRTKKAYLLPNDADPYYPAQTGLALTELYERLAALSARSVVVFIDACFSGMSRDGASLVAGTRGVVVSVEHPALRSRNMAVFSAATGDQVANAWPDRQHGLFTYWLLRGLRGDADSDRDGTVTVDELDRFVGEHVTRSAAALDREQSSEVVARDRTLAVVRLR
jgi:hypothetical protein